MEEIITVSENSDDKRVDLFLAQFGKSRTYFQKLIEKGHVKLNGKPVKKRICPKVHDVLTIFHPEPEPVNLIPDEIDLDILYEDEHFLAINKPVGLVVHPAPGHARGTFANALLYYLGKKAETNIRPGIVHRLDKDTTGVLLAAKTASMETQLFDLFKNREIKKEYIAIAIGKPKEGQHLLKMGRHKRDRKKICVREDGKESVTELEILAFNGSLSLVKLLPFTGRTHQLRVLLKHLNSPVLGDEVYGNKRINEGQKVTRQLLHSRKVTFIHPVTGKEVIIEAPLPEDMQKWKNEICD